MGFSLLQVTDVLSAVQTWGLSWPWLALLCRSWWGESGGKRASLLQGGSTPHPPSAGLTQPGRRLVDRKHILRRVLHSVFQSGVSRIVVTSQPSDWRKYLHHKWIARTDVCIVMVWPVILHVRLPVGTCPLLSVCFWQLCWPSPGPAPEEIC